MVVITNGRIVKTVKKRPEKLLLIMERIQLNFINAFLDAVH